MLRLIMPIQGRREWWLFSRGVVPALRVVFTVVGFDGCMAPVLANVLGCYYW